MKEGKGILRRKGLRDLFLEKGRTLLVAFAVFVGVFGSSIVITSYGMIKQNIKPNYRRTNPPSLVVETSPLTDIQQDTLINLEGLEELERRASLQSRIELADGSYLPMALYLVDDFSDVSVARFFPEEGAWPPAENEILLERLALPVTGYAIGNSISVQVPGEDARNLLISGTTHDPGLPPAWMEGSAYGYIRRDSAERWGWVPETETWQLTVDFDIFDKAGVSRLAETIKSTLSSRGATITSIRMPEPDVHPHEGQMMSLQMMQLSFGILALMLSAVISATMISAFLEGQIRQIAILKTVGGTRWRLIRHYLSVIALPVGSALILGLPLGIYLGSRFSAFFAALLNFEILLPNVPLPNLLLQIALGFFLPMGISLIPVLSGCSMTAREALSQYGLPKVSGAKGRKRSAGLSRFRLALAGMLRKRGRFILTVMTLVVGGMLFLTALNVRSSMSGTVVNQFARQKQDALYVLNGAYTEEELDQVFQSVSEVQETEYWINQMTSVDDPEGQGIQKVQLWAVPQDSQFYREILHQGTWSPDMDEKGIAVNEMLLETIPGFTLGDKVALDTPQGPQTFTVTAILRQPMIPPRMYVPLSHFSGDLDRYNLLMIEGSEQDRAGESGPSFSSHFEGQNSARDLSSADRLMQAVEKALDQAGMDVVSAYQTAEMEKIVRDHMQMASLFLLLLSILSLVLGGISLTMTLRLNIRDQKREMAVLKSVGAGKKILSQLIKRQSFLTALSSWVLSLILAWPISIIIGNFFGQTFFESNLDFVYAHPGPVLWGILSFVLALIAAAKPIREVLNLSVTSTLRYE